ncbi:MAG: SDR family NAD(P)-dependent oxidoreductase [Gemmataceae bacterium]
MTNDRTALAIVGIGCLFPKADGPEAFWANVRNKVDCIGPVPATHWNPDDYFDADPKRPDMTYARRGGFLEPYAFAPGEFGIAPNDLEATDTSQLLGLVATQMALRDAGLLQRPPTAGGGPDLKRVSVILGVTGTLELVIPLGARLGHPLWRKALKDAGVADAVADRVVAQIADGYVGWQENSFPGLLGNVVAGRIANRLDLGGTNCVVDAACASSLSALHLAALELQDGRADAVVTGGVDTFNDIFMYMCFSKTPALSPSGDAKPFDAAGDGTILGEGLGVVVLKRLADAERDANRIYAVIKGIGSSSDGKGNAVYAPVAAGQKRCLLSAYQQAGVSPDTIELIEAHGTGTRVGDATEIEALRDVFHDASPKRSSPWCAVGSVKSQIGHTKAAAGAAGLIKAALALYHKVLPPTIKVKKPLDVVAGSPLYVNADCRPWLPRDCHPRRAGVSAFGFGGSNFHCVLEEHDRTKPTIDWDGDVQIVALSADTKEALATKLKTWEAEGKSTDGNRWAVTRARAAEARRAFDPRAAHRVTFVVTRDKPAAGTRWEGSGPVPGKLGFLFPGQGSQSVGMLRDLACTFPAMQQVLAEADRAFAAGLVDPGDKRLSDFIYPPHAFTPDERATQEEALRATQVAQPALGAVSLGSLQILAQFGIRPDATAGHSYGELTALCAAGCFDAPSLFELSQLRGRLMAEPRGDSGAMIAVQAPLAEVETIVARARLDLVIANKNSPGQAVLSGRTAEIERAAKALGDRKVRHVRLPVAAAFHSPLVADAARPFRAALEPIAFHTAQLPVYANSTAREYPRDPQSARDLLAQQLAKPVEFVEQVQNMAAAGVRVFVEVGPGRTLTRLVESILNGTPHHAIALDASAGAKPGMVDLAQTVACLATLGYPVDVTAWDADAPPVPTTPAKPTLTVPICGANYRKPAARPEPARVASPVPSTEYRVPSIRPAPLADSGRGVPTISAAPKPLAPTLRPETPMPAEPTQPPAGLSHALQVTQDSLAAFQRLQEQTATLHRQFLETQESAQRTLHTLVEGQQRLLAASLGMAVAAPAASVERPALLPPIPSSPARVDGLTDRSRQYPVPSAPPSNPTPSLPPQRREERRTVAPEAPKPAPVAVKTSDTSYVESVLVAVVAEKTGYPPEMLDLDMGLDADLGIDSIKRVEILSALQEKLPDAPQVKPEHLGTLHTLRDIAAFLANGSNQNRERVVEAPAPDLAPRAGTGSPDVSHVQAVLVAVVAEKTGYPPEMLDLDMGLDADLGIDSIKRVEILSALQEKLPDAPQVKPEHLGTLHTLRDIAAFLANGSDQNRERERVADAPALGRFKVRRGEPPGNRSTVTLAAGSDVWLIADAEPLADAMAIALAHRGVVPRRYGWADTLPATDRLVGLVLVAPSHIGDGVPAQALRWLQAAGPALRRSRGAFATLTRLGGSFGFDALTGNPLAGALAGLAKTASFEWPEVACKAIDIATDADAPSAVDEALTRGPVEVGIAGSQRFAPELEEAPLAPAATTPFGPNDVVVISGGARGVTAEVAVALAAGGPTLVLLGRSPEPTPEPADVAACPDETSLKRALAARGGATPKQIDAQAKGVLAGREVRQTLDRIAATGAKAVYKSVDIRDAAAVRRALGGYRVTGVVHGAGVLADRKIEDLTAEQFDAVWSTKVAGLQSLLAATEGQPLKLLAVFSSSTGRFGRTGQAAYACANEALNKLAQAESRRRPGCRVVALNWGPWAGGMVTPGLAKLFAAEGVGLIPLAAGAQHLVTECSADDAVEVVLLAPGSQLPTKVHGWQPVGEAAQATVVFKRDLDLASAPVLRAHVIDGRAVMPLALSLQWLAHAAMHGNPGLAFAGCDNLRVLHPLIVAENRVTAVRAVAGKPTRENSVYRVVVELRGERDGRDIAFSRADVLLADTLPAAPSRDPWPALPSYALDVDDVYQRVLFHGPELRGLESIDGCGPLGITVTTSTAPTPTVWLTQPLRSTWLADPLVLDCAFQAMIVWTHAERALLSLPTGVSRYRQYRRSFPAGEMRVMARVTGSSGATVRADLDFVAADGSLVATIDGYECVLDGGLTAAFRRNRLEPARV